MTTTKEPEAQTHYLTENNCNRTFHNLLRSQYKDKDKEDKDDKPKQFPPYLFPKNVNPIKKNLPELHSNIESYQVTAQNTEPKPSRHRKYIKDNVMFDDSYTDFNQKLHPTKRLFTQTVTQNQSSLINQSNSNSNTIAKKTNTTLNRRVKENYTNNPMQYMNKTQINEYNNETKKMMEIHGRRVADYMSSKNIQKTFLNSSYSTKNLNVRMENINTTPLVMYKNAIEQKREEPNYNKKSLLTTKSKTNGGIFSQ